MAHITFIENIHTFTERSKMILTTLTQGRPLCHIHYLMVQTPGKLQSVCSQLPESSRRDTKTGQYLEQTCRHLWVSQKRPPAAHTR